jgi:hypothetical protein
MSINSAILYKDSLNIQIHRPCFGIQVGNQYFKMLYLQAENLTLYNGEHSEGKN